MPAKPKLFRLLNLGVLVTVLVLSAAPPQAAASPRNFLELDTLWEEAQTLQAPPSRYIHGMAYDSQREVMVLFGGDGTGRERRSDTWEYNGQNWSQITPTQSPPGRVNIQGAMAFAANRNRMVLFGGLAAAGYQNDTWEYNGSTWSQVSTANQPLPRDSHTMVYDSQRGVIVLFGGYNPTTNYLNDTWEYNGSNWQQVNTPQSPPGRHHHAMVYDSQRRVVVLFGGHGQADPQMDDTWEYNGTTWQQVSPAQSPPGRDSHAMAYNQQRGTTVLFGGTADGSDPLQDTWEYDGVEWQQASTSLSPPARLGFPMAYDSERDRVVLFGGASRLVRLTVSDDTWEHIEDPTPRDRIVQEARVDVGMPFGIDRGCPSPYIGCGEPFHGFSHGVCTDIVLDAYGYGASIDLQNALVQDHNANPGRYLFGTARYAEDMQRYFEHNQVLVPHQESYLKGDIAFFDWDGDGISDHTVVVTQVDASGRPLWVVDARGYAVTNWHGKATEESWSSFYEQYQPSHARLGIPAPTAPVTTTQTTQELRIRLSEPLMQIKLQDDNGKVISDQQSEELIASNVKAFIPYLPASSYSETISQTVVTVFQPLENSLDYHVELSSQSAMSFTLHIETLHDGNLTDQETFTQSIGAGETHRVEIKLKAHPGISIDSASYSASPTLVAPDLVTITGTTGTSPQTAFTFSEIGGLLGADNVSIQASLLSNQMGGTIPASRVSITPANFNLAASGDREVSVQVDLADIPPGMYHGHLQITSQNANPISVPFTVVVDHYMRFLPMIVLN